MALLRPQLSTAAAVAVVVLCMVTAPFAAQPRATAAVAAMTLIAALTGTFLTWRVPRNPVGPALAWTGAAVAAVMLIGVLVESADRGRSLPFSQIVRPFAVGIWPANLAGFLALLLVFPDGRLHGRRWALLPWLYAACTLGVVVALWDARMLDGRVVAGGGTGHLALLLASMLGIAGCLVGAVTSVAVRYRSGDAHRRAQIRWLVLAGCAVVVLLLAGWVADTAGARVEMAFTPFVAAIVVLVPLAVAVAVVREDLFDVDRLLSSGSAWLITALLAAGAYAALLLLVERLLHVGDTMGPTLAAFVTALALLPVHRVLVRAIGSVVDRERTVALAGVRSFESDVRAGRREPEDVETVLRAAQHDGGLQLFLRHEPDRWVRVDGTPAAAPDGIPIEAGGEQIARIRISHPTARARRRVAELTGAAWVSIEVCRLRLGLAAAVTELRSTHDRLSAAAATERRRLERDLHDGIQQRLVATGMRLSLVRRGLRDEVVRAELDAAVGELEATISELRRLAQGVRPSRLDDGLGAALEAVRRDSPLPLELVVEQLPVLDENRALAAYLIVAEAVTNALKHAHARRLWVRVGGSGDGLRIQVRDDGSGGLDGHRPVTLCDRVRAAGGRLEVRSAPGEGTTVEVVM